MGNGFVWEVANWSPSYNYTWFLYYIGPPPAFTEERHQAVLDCPERTYSSTPLATSGPASCLGLFGCLGFGLIYSVPVCPLLLHVPILLDWESQWDFTFVCREKEMSSCAVDVHLYMRGCRRLIFPSLASLLFQDPHFLYPSSSSGGIFPLSLPQAVPEIQNTRWIFSSTWQLFKSFKNHKTIYR